MCNGRQGPETASRATLSFGAPGLLLLNLRDLFLGNAVRASRTRVSFEAGYAFAAVRSSASNALSSTCGVPAGCSTSAHPGRSCFGELGL